MTTVQITNTFSTRSDRLLEGVEIPPLLAALALATDDDSFIAPEWRPQINDDDVLIPAQGGMSDKALSLARHRVLEALDGGLSWADTGLSIKRLRRVAAFIVGENNVDDYLPMLAYEFGLSPEGTSRAESPAPADKQRDFHVVVIGAGMSGIAAAVQLQRAGLHFTIIERSADVGGVWHENNYPGCRLDTSNFAYSYSWAQKTDWGEQYSSREAIVQYFNDVVTTEGLREKTLFNTSLTRAIWDETTHSWNLELQGPSGKIRTMSANAVISAVGQLSQASYPSIPGREDFAGISVHTATWPKSLVLDGKRVAVIGSGASAFQLVPELAENVGSLSVFQRSAPWMLPTPTYKDPVPDGMAHLLSSVPNYHRWFRFYQYWTTQSRHKFARVDPSWNRAESVSADNDKLRSVLLTHIHERFADNQGLLPAVTPNYPPYGKRMLRDDGSWAFALKQENTNLITDPIVQITSKGIQTSTELVEVDCIVYATGFRATEFLDGIDVVGQGGQSLHDKWGDNPRAYLGVSVPGFPNFFCLYGPNTNLVVNGSLVAMTEAGVAHIMRCMRHMFDEGGTAITCRQEALDRFTEELDNVNSGMAWGMDGVNNWYKNAAGRVTQNWPLTVDEYFRRASGDPVDDYILDNCN